MDVNRLINVIKFRWMIDSGIKDRPDWCIEIPPIPVGVIDLDEGERLKKNGHIYINTGTGGLIVGKVFIRWNKNENRSNKLEETS